VPDGAGLAMDLDMENCRIYGSVIGLVWLYLIIICVSGVQILPPQPFLSITQLIWRFGG